MIGRDILRAFVDEVAPKHFRTSCTDDDSRGNEYFNEQGYPHCVRCALLYRVAHGHWPHGVEFRIVDLRTATGDDSAKVAIGPRAAELALRGLRRLDTDQVREAEDLGLTNALSRFAELRTLESTDLARAMGFENILPNGRVQGGPEDRAHWWTCSVCHFTGPLVGLCEDGKTRACLASCGGVDPNPETTTFKQEDA